MVKIEKQKCDHCDNETEDYHAEVGWIHFVDGFYVSISKGRTESRKAESIVKDIKSSSYSKRDVDFCNINCLIQYFKKVELGLMKK